MSTSITFPAPDGAIYIIPAVDDEDWGQNVTNFLLAIPAGVPPRNGVFSLTGDLSFGPTFGLVSNYYKSSTALPASAGALRLAHADTIEWRNSTNTGNNILNLVGDGLTYNGSPLTLASLTNSHIFVGNGSNVPIDVAMSGDITITNAGVTTISAGAVTNTKVASGAAIAVSKLAVITANRAVATDGSGFLTSSTTTDTELGYVSGVTSSIQAQINAISSTSVPVGTILEYAGSSAPSGFLMADGSSYATASFPALFAVIGYIYGGAGPNFQVPDKRDRAGIGQGGTIAPSLGTPAGSAVHALVDADMPTTAVTVGITDPGHGHRVWTTQNTGLLSCIGLRDSNANGFASTATNGTGSSGYFTVDFNNHVVVEHSLTGITASGTINGGATPFSIVQPVLGLNYIIKT